MSAGEKGDQQAQQISTLEETLAAKSAELGEAASSCMLSQREAEDAKQQITKMTTELQVSA